MLLPQHACLETIALKVGKNNYNHIIVFLTLRSCVQIE